jgi:hypothetical protein
MSMEALEVAFERLKANKDQADFDGTKPCRVSRGLSIVPRRTTQPVSLHDTPSQPKRIPIALGLISPPPVRHPHQTLAEPVIHGFWQNEGAIRVRFCDCLYLSVCHWLCQCSSCRAQLSGRIAGAAMPQINAQTCPNRSDAAFALGCPAPASRPGQVRDRDYESVGRFNQVSQPRLPAKKINSPPVIPSVAFGLR